MTEREMLIEGLKICTDADGHKTCEDCPYDGCTGPSCGTRLSRAALAALQEDMDRIEELEDTVHNLRRYMTALKRLTPAELWEAFEKKMSGLPGFVEVWKDDD